MIFFYVSYKSIIKKTILFFLLAGSFVSAAAQTLYVKPSGNDANTGASWATAFKTVAKALNVAVAGKNIWVAAGTYYPTASVDRTISFALKNGVSLYGGFAGTETLLSQRNYTGNQTILSGDIGSTGVVTDNSIHVVYSAPGTDASAIIDGFTITLGQADVDDNYSVRGGGMLNDGGGPGNNCAPVIRNCKFINNYAAVWGGAMSNAGLNGGNCNPFIDNCSFINNKADFGGAIDNYGDYSAIVSPYFSKCVFAQNTATYFGGAIITLMHRSAFFSPTYANCLFTDNNAGFGGGAIQNKSTTDGTGSCLSQILNCTFNNNVAGTGSAIGNELPDPTGLISTTIKASIIWSSITTSPPIDNNPNATTVVSYSDIIGGYSGSGNMNINPLFANAANPAGSDNIWGTADDGLQLTGCSPVLNLGGSVSSGFPTDLANQARIFNGSLDMGGYELQQLPDGTGLALPGATGAHTIYTGINGAMAPNCRIFCRIEPKGASPVNGNINLKLTLDAAVQTYNGKPYVTRHYDITPVTNPSTATAKITLFFTQVDFNIYNAFAGVTVKLPTGPADVAGISHLHISQFHGTSASSQPGTYTGTTQFIDPADADIIWNATTSRWEVSFNVTGFSGFFVHSSSAALPLTLIRFAATRSNGYNLLQWTTASELNTAAFEIQRSENAVGFSAIGNLQAAGSSSTEQQYQYTDKAPQAISAPFVWYRLKMIDKDNRYSYSNIVKISASIPGELVVRVAPNPFRQNIFVELVSPQQEEAELTLSDISGKKMLTRKALLIRGDNQLQLNAANLFSHTVYILRVTTKNSTRITRLLKE